ncbi:hypothetical protein BO94DRAFT_583337 [Aspergillus sclerotioniger CBS 115572]|uniref:CBM1 domain-containing protein n=1 Tax=Aspergillus sclerotioniger CBS 115572 TaxID=1450535 RepID=A0A317X6B0_9EURO|nr:hypothetical protein BO94DRAFT_583337 [Aspergillus sclerotioniger CBS 115572]PWY93097.1 hypothetical protein BO94DRAFT_583337 [Aspergillus sclerotioniger CBS 115572]
MQIQTLAITLLTTLVASVQATVTLGSGCSGSGYDCTSTFNDIAVCNGAQWVLAAKFLEWGMGIDG